MTDAQSSAAGCDALLIQPASGGRISGGYLYNSRMARHGAWELWAGEVAQVSALASRIRHPVVIVDSLWLTGDALEALLPLQRRGVRVGALIHALPSRLAAAEAAQPPPGEPSTAEVDALRRLDFAIVPGPFYAGLLAGIAREVHVFEPGIDDAWRARPRAREGRCELVSVGAVTRLKGFADVLDALAGWASPEDVRWTVAGSVDVDSAYAARLRDRARAPHAVSLLGQLAPHGVRELVQRSHVLVMSSYEENHPLVLLEACAASTPCVAYAAGGTPALIEHGITGLVAPIGDRATLGEHLAALVRDEHRRFEMARACWERQVRLPSWREAARRARAVLANVAATPRTRT